MKTKTPSLDEKLKKLVMRHGWITEQDDWLQAIDDIKNRRRKDGYHNISCNSWKNARPDKRFIPKPILKESKKGE